MLQRIRPFALLVIGTEECAIAALVHVRALLEQKHHHTRVLIDNCLMERRETYNNLFVYYPSKSPP